jgi:hypothetical protein
LLSISDSFRGDFPVTTPTPRRFIRALVRAGRLRVFARGIPDMVTAAGERVPLGRAGIRYEEGTGITPQDEGEGLRNLELISLSRITPIFKQMGRGWSSRHNVFLLPPNMRTKDGKRIAMKIFYPSEEFGPRFARIESDNLIWASAFYRWPFVRHLRSDLSIRGRGEKQHKFGRLFTAVPPSHVALHQLDYGKMDDTARFHLLANLGASHGYSHRRRARHGDLHLANILTDLERLRREPEHPENIMYLDAETFEPLLEGVDPKEFFPRDTRLFATHAGMVGLVRDPEELKRHYHPRYMDMWRGSRLEKEIASIEPNVLFQRLPTQTEMEKQQPGAEIRQTLRERLYRRSGIDPND